MQVALKRIPTPSRTRAAAVTAPHHLCKAMAKHRQPARPSSPPQEAKTRPAPPFPQRCSSRGCQTQVVDDPVCKEPGRRGRRPPVREGPEPRSRGLPSPPAAAAAPEAGGDFLCPPRPPGTGSAGHRLRRPPAQGSDTGGGRSGPAAPGREAAGHLPGVSGAGQKGRTRASRAAAGGIGPRGRGVGGSGLPGGRAPLTCRACRCPVSVHAWLPGPQAPSAVTRAPLSTPPFLVPCSCPCAGETCSGSCRILCNLTLSRGTAKEEGRRNLILKQVGAAHTHPPWSRMSLYPWTSRFDNMALFLSNSITAKTSICGCLVTQMDEERGKTNAPDPRLQ